jgi:hypothetical protein
MFLSFIVCKFIEKATELTLQKETGRMICFAFVHRSILLTLAAWDGHLNFLAFDLNLEG